MELTSKDNIYAQIRNLNFNALGMFLPAKMDEVKQILADKDKQQSLEELSNYLEKFKKIKEEYESVKDRKFLIN